MSAATALKAVPSQGDRAASAMDLRRNPPRLLDLHELCIFLSISDRHARDLIAERKLPAIRLGRRLLFDTQRVLAAIEKLPS